MYKKYGLLLAAFCVVPQVHALPNFVHQAMYFGSDLWKLCKPEWRTGVRHDPVYKKDSAGVVQNYQIAFKVVQKDGRQSAVPVEYSDIEEQINALSDGPEKTKQLNRLHQKGEAPGIFEYSYEVRESEEAIEKTHKRYLDGIGQVFAACDDGELYPVEQEGMQFRFIHEGAPRYVIRAAAKCIESIKSVSHEDQTEEKVGTMHYLKPAYSMKCNTTLLGYYIFMKPYALACAAGLTIGVYTLLKKLGVYELMKPSAQGLEPDELDGK